MPRRRSIVELEETLAKNLQLLKDEREKLSQVHDAERATLAREQAAASAYLNGRIQQAEEALKLAQLEDEPAQPALAQVS